MEDFEYYNAKKLVSDVDIMDLDNETQAAVKRTIHYLPLGHDRVEFNDYLVNFTVSTIHVPTNIYDKCKSKHLLDLVFKCVLYHKNMFDVDIRYYHEIKKVRVYMHSCIHTYILTYIHTHTHIYIYIYIVCVCVWSCST